jgi:hypothetical protein
LEKKDYFTFFWSRGYYKNAQHTQLLCNFQKSEKSHSKILGNASWRHLQVKNIFVTLEKMGKSHLGEKSLFKSITG